MMRKPKATRRPGIETRRRICEAALACYAEQGVARTSLADISRKSGLKHQLLLYHFPDLLSLQLAVVHLALDDLRDRVVRAIEAHERDPARALEAYATATFSWARQNPGLFSIWCYFYYEATRQGPFQDLNTAIRTAGRRRIEALIHEGVSRGVFRPPRAADVDCIALTVQTLLTGGVILAYTEQGGIARSARRATIDAILAVVGGEGTRR